MQKRLRGFAAPPRPNWNRPSLICRSGMRGRTCPHFPHAPGMMSRGGWMTVFSGFPRSVSVFVLNFCKFFCFLFFQSFLFFFFPFIVVNSVVSIAEQLSAFVSYILTVGFRRCRRVTGQAVHMLRIFVMVLGLGSVVWIYGIGLKVYGLCYWVWGYI